MAFWAAKARFVQKKHGRKINYIIILALLLVIMHVFNKNKTLDIWSAYLDPIIGLGTFLLAILISIFDLSQEWELSLPKRLTVIFKYQGNPIIICENAYLASEADKRAWGQQIGGQMNAGNLAFYPYIEEVDLEIQSYNGKKYKTYKIIFNLKDLPVPNSKDEDSKKKIDTTFRLRFAKECKLWKQTDDASDLYKSDELWVSFEEAKQLIG